MALQANQEKAQRLHDAGARAAEAQAAVELAATHADDVAAARAAVAAASAACLENSKVRPVPRMRSHPVSALQLGTPSSKYSGFVRTN